MNEKFQIDDDQIPNVLTENKTTTIEKMIIKIGLVPTSSFSYIWFGFCGFTYILSISPSLSSFSYFLLIMGSNNSHIRIDND